jgi:hypothetical protein
MNFTSPEPLIALIDRHVLVDFDCGTAALDDTNDLTQGFTCFI